MTLNQRDTLSSSLTFRLTEKLRKKILANADMYAEGDVSAWIRHCCDEYNPKFVKAKKRPAKKKS